MLGRAGHVVRQAKPAVDVHSRTMVTAAALRARIKTVKNVRKITGVMKMVAASKLRAAQRVLTIARSFQQDVTTVWPEQEPEGKTYDKILYAGITSDSGLCGGVNSAVVRGIKKEAIALKKKGSSSELDMVIYGGKGVSGLSREFANEISYTFTEIGKLKFLTFRQVCELADPLLTRPYDKCSLWYNLYRSPVAYDTVDAAFFPLETAVGDGKFLEPYEIEGDQDALQSFHEFRTAVRLFHYMAEADTSTLSSRMNAMENSSKNAGEMLEKLSLVLNRTRQARITTELIEIISGAVAAEEMKNK